MKLAAFLSAAALYVYLGFYIQHVEKDLADIKTRLKSIERKANP